MSNRLALCAMLLALGAAARAQQYGVNLLSNPGAEASPAAPDGHTAVPVTGWYTGGGFTVARYGAAGLPDITDAPPDGQTQFFWGGSQGTNAYADSPSISLSAYAADIDAHLVTLHMEAELSGYGDQADTATVHVFVPGEGDHWIAQTGGSSTGFGFTLHSAEFLVPAGVRNINVELTARRAAGTDNDAYFDNVKCILYKRLPAGDINGSGGPDADDAVKALRIAAGLRPPTGAMPQADVAPVTGTFGNRVVGDGQITAADAIRILRATQGLEPAFP